MRLRTSVLRLVKMNFASPIFRIATYAIFFSQVMFVGTSVSRALDISESFYRLHPGMTAQDINAITGQSLPLLCKTQGHTLDIDRTNDKYSISIDLGGRLTSMNSIETHPNGILSDDYVRAVANKHRCGNGKQFKLENEYMQLVSRNADLSKPRSVKIRYIRFCDKYSSRMIASPSLMNKSEHVIECSRTAEWALWSYRSVKDLCQISRIFCPAPRPLSGGSRF